MGGKLIIAEKPQLGRLIAAAVPGPESSADGVITKGEYTIVWAFGHLLTLKEPADYDLKYKKWRLEDLPIFFPDWQVKPKTGGQRNGGTSPAARLKQIVGLIRGADVIINAGDPDDEGQLLIDEIIRYSGTKKPVCRLDTSDTTESALRRALADLRPNSDFTNNGWAAYARSVADMMVGVNLSRYFSVTNNALLTIGRVQTPTLGLVVARDLAIENHVKQLYYEITADVLIDGQTVRAKYVPAKEDEHLDDDGRITSAEYAAQIAASLRGAEFDNAKVSERTVREDPPLPFDLAELQYAAGIRYKYTPQQVMDITQRLRDKYNAITYNRSECRYLHESQWPEAPALMQTVCRNIRYRPGGLNLHDRPKCYDDKKADSAHTGIIPQNVDLDITKFSEDEKNIYLLICRNFMAQFLPQAEKRVVSLFIPLPDGGKLTASSTELLKEGWRALFKNSGGREEGAQKEEETSPLSRIAPGMYHAIVTDASSAEKETKPPARYTQTTLNKDMTRISRYVDDAEIKHILLEKDKDKKGENGSIGTAATRASIITGLIERGYLREDRSRHLISTPLARELIRILPTELKKPNLTARWWVIQEDIRAGKCPCTDLTDSVLEMIRNVLHAESTAIDKTAIPERTAAVHKVVGTCPRCGKDVRENDKGFGCSGWKQGCKFVIWKKPKGSLFSKTRITASDASGLLQGKTIQKKTLMSSKGTSFTAGLQLDDAAKAPYGATLKLIFNNDPPTRK